MRQQALITGFCILSCLFSTRVRAANFSGLYVFGDSLSDNGNFYQQTLTTTPSPAPPFPQDSNGAYPGPPYYMGRFSNGPVWVEMLNSKLGIPNDSVSNFASGGAGSGTFHQAGSAFPGMATQINQYLTLTGNTAEPDALYILSAGSNDYSDPIFSDLSLVPLSVVSNLSNELAILKLAGARNFLILGVPDFSKIPQNAGLSEQELAQLKALSYAHNTTLATAIPLWSKELNSNITFLDINELLTDFINNPKRYNFSNVTNPCVLIVSCRNDPKEQDNFLFWDTAHITVASHRHLADFAVEKLAVGVPEPSSVLGIFGVMGIASLLKSQRKN